MAPCDHRPVRSARRLLRNTFSNWRTLPAKAGLRTGLGPSGRQFQEVSGLPRPLKRAAASRNQGCTWAAFRAGGGGGIGTTCKAEIEVFAEAAFADSPAGLRIVAQMMRTLTLRGLRRGQTGLDGRGLEETAAAWFADFKVHPSHISSETCGAAISAPPPPRLS